MTRSRRERGPDSHSDRQPKADGVSPPTYFMTPAEILHWLERTDARVGRAKREELVQKSVPDSHSGRLCYSVVLPILYCTREPPAPCLRCKLGLHDRMGVQHRHGPLPGL